MKNILLYTLGIMFGIVGFSGISAKAAPVPDNWSQKLKCETSCPRFTVLKNWDDAAVLDKETGLVWEQSPDTTNLYTWSEAHIHCNQLVVSNRMGWRHPTYQELASLIDKSQTNPAIPSGHPFTDDLETYYWTATTSAGSPLTAWLLNMGTGEPDVGAKAGEFYIWCVRGGSGVDAQ